MTMAPVRRVFLSLYFSFLFHEILTEEIRKVSVRLKTQNNDATPVLLDKTGNEKSGTVTVLGRQVLVAQKWPVWQFRGIPYAEPPVGDLRFRRPVPKKHLPNAIVDASTQDSKACIGQFPERDSVVDDIELGSNINEVRNSISEDCLHLNIWTKPVRRNGGTGCGEESAAKQLLPVMVEFHGGGYFAGSGDLTTYDGSVLAAKKDVVVVVFNYRLFIFGFLGLGIEEAPGNQALWDAVEAPFRIHDEFGVFIEG